MEKENTDKERVGGRAITLTFGDMVDGNNGFNQKDFKSIRLQNTEIVNLKIDEKYSDASVLIIRNGVERILGSNQMDLFNEQLSLEYDKQAYMYGRIVNKHARWNVSFDHESQEPDYISGKGRIIGYDRVPLLSAFLDKLPVYFGVKAYNLKVDSNYYYDINKCGIGFHGDSERRKVIGIRLGEQSSPLYFQWYLNNVADSNPIKIELNVGDIYIMSEKACGTDWKRRTTYTLRHATGCKKFVESVEELNED